MVMWRSQFSSTMPKTKVAETPPRLKPTIFLFTLITLSTLLIAGNASASDNLQLVPDFGLFNWFGESYFGDLWIMIIGFVLLVFPLNQLIFQPIFRSLDDRAEKINGARNRSVDLQKQADDVLDRYEIAIREARGESEQTRQAGLIRAREEQATLTAEARAEAMNRVNPIYIPRNHKVEEAFVGAVENQRSGINTGRPPTPGRHASVPNLFENERQPQVGGSTGLGDP